MAISATELHRFTVAEFERMAEFGVLPESGVELVDGLVVAMSPKGDRPAYAIGVMNELFVDRRAERYVVYPENLTLRLSMRDARDPDLVLARRIRSYTRERPRPEEVALIVEVADSSLAYDLGDKRAAYARSGIPEYWVVDIPSETVHVFRGAGNRGNAVCGVRARSSRRRLRQAGFRRRGTPANAFSANRFAPRKTWTVWPITTAGIPGIPLRARRQGHGRRRRVRDLEDECDLFGLVARL